MPRWLASPAARSSSAVKPPDRAFAASPRPGREPEPELLRDLLTETAAREVLAHRRARVGVPQVPLEEHRRLLERLVETVAMLLGALRRRRGLLVLELHPEPVGQPLDRADEVEALGLAHEGDHVALRAAAEAVVELVDRVDREAGRALVVERAAARVPGAALAQSGALRDDLDDVGRRDRVANRGVLDARHLLEGASVCEREPVGHAGHVVGHALDLVTVGAGHELGAFEEMVEDQRHDVVRAGMLDAGARARDRRART